MKQEPRLTVFIPNYNHARFLPESVGSACRQAAGSVEVVVADNASDDDSLAVLEELQKRFSFKILRHRKNLGALQAHNLFLETTSATHVLLLAADDKLLPGSLERIRMLLQKYPEAGFCLWNLLELGPGGQTRVLSYRHPSGREHLTGPQFLRDFAGQPLIGQAAFSVSHLKAMGGIPESLRWHADHYVCHALGIRHGMIFCPEPLGVFRRLPASMGSGMEGPEQGEVLQEFVRLLSQPENHDLQVAMKECRALSIFGPWLRRELPKTPEGRFFWDENLKQWFWRRELRTLWRNPAPPMLKKILRSAQGKLAQLRFKENVLNPVRKPLLGLLRSWVQGRESLGIPAGWVVDSCGHLAQNAGEGRILFRRQIFFPEVPPSRIVLPQPHPNLSGKLGGQTHDLWLAELPDAEVSGPSIAVLTNQGVLLGAVSVEWGRNPDDHGVMRRFRLPAAVPLKGTTVLLATTGGNTYFHWMTEVLPRLRVLAESGVPLDSIDHFLVNRIDGGFPRESLRAFGIPESKCRITQMKCRYRCERLLVPSLPGPHGWVDASTCTFLRETFLQPASGASPKKIFIPRGRTRGRQSRRESEIQGWLRGVGFEVFDAGETSLRQQARTFAGAEVVVGIHGAAMTNLMFCRPGTRVVEIFGWRYVNPCYRFLASAVGARHHAVLDAVPGRLPPIPSYEFSSVGLDGNLECLQEMMEILDPEELSFSG